MSLLKKIQGRARRDASRLFFRRLAYIEPKAPIVSFTFDDFPRSALFEAGAMLSSFGWQGTYFASFGLMGRVAPTGQIFSVDDLPELLRQGHELGCHTFDHCHSWETAPEMFDTSIRRNQQALEELLPTKKFRVFSYPISGPRPATKRCVQRHFACARGGGQTFNLGTTDLNLVNAFFLEQSRRSIDSIKRVIDGVVDARGWLIFATHDVASDPTPYGVTPSFFKEVLKYVNQSGATVLPMGQIFDQPSILR